MQLLRFLGFAAAAVAAPAFHAARDAAAVPDQFIVVIKDGAGDNALETTIESVLGIVGGTDTAPLLAHTIGSFRAFTMTVGDSSLVQMISDLAHVSWGRLFQRPGNPNASSLANRSCDVLLLGCLRRARHNGYDQCSGHAG